MFNRLFLNIKASVIDQSFIVEFINGQSAAILRRNEETVAADLVITADFLLSLIGHFDDSLPGGSISVHWLLWELFLEVIFASTRTSTVVQLGHEPPQTHECVSCV